MQWLAKADFFYFFVVREQNTLLYILRLIFFVTHCVQVGRSDRSLDQVGEMEHNYIETPISVKKKLLKKFLRISTQLDELSRLVKKYF